MSVNLYTFSYQNPGRRARMEERFEAEGLALEFVEPVEATDSRIELAPPSQKRTWAIMWNHLDMLKAFLESDAEFGIFAEDDITIRRGLKALLPELTAVYRRLNLEILLRGYLLNYQPVTTTVHPEFVGLENYTYLNYNDSLWGSQMYLLDRKTAQKFLSTYTVEYARNCELNPSQPYFSPDWTLTKVGRRAAIYPMLAVEEGQVATSHEGQAAFHQQCRDAQMSSLYH